MPVIIFTIVFLVLTLPLFPASAQIFAPLAALDTQWQIIIITFFAILLSGLLYNLNTPIIRFYEGYTWEKTWIGKSCKRHYQSLFETRYAKINGMRTLLRAMVSPSVDVKLKKSVNKQLGALRTAPGSSESWEELYDSLHSKFDGLQQDLYTEFPTNSDLILPTQLGNVIRSFEYYPDREYGMDGVTTWSRLIAKIDPGYAATIDDAKTSFDFMLNCSFVSTVLSFVMILTGLIYQKPFASQEALIFWMIESLFLIVFAIWFYSASISRAAAWGETVKGAFDLYRNDLLKPLGYKREVKTKRAERDLWGNISIQMIYGDRPEGPLEPNYEEESPPSPPPAPPTSVLGRPKNIDFELTRGVKHRSFNDGSFTIVISVKNIDKKMRTAWGVVVKDTLPDGLDYQWDSARSSVAGLYVEGTNPYRFHIGNMYPDDEVILTYRATARE